MRCIVLTLLLLSTAAPSAFAQFKIELGDGRELTITQAVQAWDVVSFRMNGSSADTRNDIYLRRGRFGLEGKLRSNVSFNLSVAYDGIGKDSYTPTSGSANAGDNRDLFIWDASWIWSHSPEFNIVFGYFRPQVGREQMGSEFYVLSFDKSLADGLPRLHLLGRSTGRETGVNVGGLLLRDGWSLNYNAGMFDPSSSTIIGTGRKWSPLLTGRLALSVGDPEMTQYKISYGQGGYGKRNGATIGVNAARQGATVRFSSNALYGADLLANYGPLDVSAEYDWLRRSTTRFGGSTPTTDAVFHVKAGVYIPITEDQAIEPTAMFTGERGDDGTDYLSLHSNFYTGASDRDLYDAGVNWLIDKDRFKINLHVVWGKNYYASVPEFFYLGLGTQMLY
jgi:hypothetical protein